MRTGRWCIDMTSTLGRADDHEFQLFLFATKEDLILEAVSGGIAGVIVDWENKDKSERQAGFDTQINNGTVEDLKRVRALTDALVICRINGFFDKDSCRDEIALAVDAGANEIFLPMVRTVREVETALEYAAGQCGVGILIETADAVGLAKELGHLPLTRVYVGLNDLAIDRNLTNIFESIDDDTVGDVRPFIKVPFGFAGLTSPELGSPIPCRLLIGEMARLNSDFSFLRRAFFRDMRDRDATVEIPRILEALRRARLRSPEAVAQDRRDLEMAIRAMPRETVGVQSFSSDG